MQLGTYEHYKGKKYKVLGVAKHSETEDFFVVYEPLYPCEQKLWIRPLEMFESTVLVNKVEISRFKFISE